MRIPEVRILNEAAQIWVAAGAQEQGAEVVIRMVNDRTYIMLSELGWFVKGKLGGITARVSLTLVEGISYTGLIQFMRLTFTEGTCIRY